MTWDVTFVHAGSRRITAQEIKPSQTLPGFIEFINQDRVIIAVNGAQVLTIELESHDQ